MGKFVSQNNLSYFWQKIKTLLSGKADKSEIPTNTVKYSSQSLTDAQKSQARTNIGAGTSNFSGSYNDLSNKPTLFSGNYNDLTNKPTIPTNTNQLTNGAGFITSSSLGTQATFSLSGTTLTITPK